MSDFLDDEFKSTENGDKKPLWEDIRKFSKSKYFIVGILLILAMLGAIIPIIPGIILFILAMALLRKGWMAKIRSRFRLWKIKD